MRVTLCSHSPQLGGVRARVALGGSVTCVCVRDPMRCITLGLRNDARGGRLAVGRGRSRTRCRTSVGGRACCAGACVPTRGLEMRIDTALVPSIGRCRRSCMHVAAGLSRALSHRGIYTDFFKRPKVHRRDAVARSADACGGRIGALHTPLPSVAHGRYELPPTPLLGPLATLCHSVAGGEHPPSVADRARRDAPSATRIRGWG